MSWLVQVCTVCTYVPSCVCKCVHCDISGCSADIYLMHKCVVLSPYNVHMSRYIDMHMSPYVVGSEKRGNIVLLRGQRYGSKHIFM